MKRGNGMGPVRAALASVILLFVPITHAQKTEQSTYVVRPKALIRITNNYGPITVKVSRGSQVSVRAVANSDVVSFENEQHGNRIELRSVSRRPGLDLAEYTVLVPSDSWVMLQSSAGALHAERLAGDIVMEAGSGAAEVSEMDDAHIHVKTLSGPVSLTAIRNCHLDVHSVTGSVSMRNVTGSLVDVNSGRGRINYEGDPGQSGQYRFTSHTGDLEVSIPANATVEIKANSFKGESNQGNPETRSSLPMSSPLLKPGIVNISRFVLRSFSGKINVKRP